MRPLYGREARYLISNTPECFKGMGKPETYGAFSCKLDVWLRKDVRIFVRFWSPRKCLDILSFELRGHPIPKAIERGRLLDESWIPEIIRDEYELWVVDCLEYPDGD